MLVFAATLLVATCQLVSSHGFHEHCRESLAAGRENIATVAESIANSEIGRLAELIVTSTTRMQQYQEERTLYSDDFQSLIKRRDDDDDPPCPQPNNTWFTTPKAPTTTTTTTTNVDTTPTVGTTSSDQGTTTNQPTNFQARPIYTKSNDQDPFASYMGMLHYYQSREDTVCNNELTDINSITEDQLFGYFSTLAAAHPGPFCSLCHRFTEEVHQRLFTPNKLLTTDDEYHFNNLLFSHVPSPKTICSAIAPGCHKDYPLKVGNLTKSVVCLECTACMAVTNVVEHKFLLQKSVVDAVYVFLRGNLFHNVCAELCWKFHDQSNRLFPHGVTYDGCQAVMKKKYYQLVEVAAVILRPERFCSLELKWCELNEQPNIIHCARELCQEYFKDTPQTRWICSQIPDRPEQADAFLNIRQTKVYKEKKDYHTKFEQRNLHDEL